MATKTNFLCDFPIKFLQDKFHGIKQGDLIMIAALSGRGKSTTSRMILRQAMDDGVKSAFYSLEDEEGTFAKKTAHQLYLRTAFEPMDYRTFEDIFDCQPSMFINERQEVAKFLYRKASDGQYLLLMHEMKSPQWTIEEVIEQMKKEAENGYKLFVLDHFDRIVPSVPQIQTEAINKLWDFVALNKVALITFTQLKSGRNMEALCPSLSDIKGAQAKFETPTIVISTAWNTGDVYKEYPGSATYCRILKDRKDGKRSCAVIFFQNDAYLPKYVEVECNDSGTCIDGLTMRDINKKK